MAAVYWRLVFLGELVLALVSAAALAATSSLSLPWLALTSLGILLLCPWILTGISFVIAWQMRRLLRAESPASRTETLRAWWTESSALSQVMLSMSIEPWREWHFRGAADTRGPVLLIHGIACNRGVWRALARKLLDQGFGPVHAVNLEPLFADIDTQAEQVVDELRRLRRDCGGARVAIVAHSMGGLVARAALRQGGADDTAQLVTLGSPHHGTALSVMLPNLPYRQMRLGSPWLAVLNSAQEGRFPVPVTTLYSANDNLVIPATNATLTGATSAAIRGIGHLGLLTTRQAMNRTLAALASSSEQGVHCHA